MIGPANLWHYAPESHGYTDLVTNHVLLSGLQIDHYVRRLGDRSIEISPVVATFLHESTHHWCFDSLVGGTIAMLELQAMRHATVSRCATHKEQYHVFDCLLRARVASNLLRPLAEGLALFAEYDAVPGASPQISTPLLGAIYCFGLPTMAEDDKLLPWKATLQLLRRSPGFCARKASVLQRPFSCEDAYLPGYMSVKSLWRSAARRSSQFMDTDLFLAFVKGYFYEDPRFVSAILDPEAKEVRAAQGIYAYFLQRTNEFLSLDIESAVNEWLAGGFGAERRERTYASMARGIGATVSD